MWNGVSSGKTNSPGAAGEALQQPPSQVQTKSRGLPVHVSYYSKAGTANQAPFFHALTRHFVACPVNLTFFIRLFATLIPRVWG